MYYWVCLAGIWYWEIVFFGGNHGNGMMMRMIRMRRMIRMIRVMMMMMMMLPHQQFPSFLEDDDRPACEPRLLWCAGEGYRVQEIEEPLPMEYMLLEFHGRTGMLPWNRFRCAVVARAVLTSTPTVVPSHPNPPGCQEFPGQPELRVGDIIRTIGPWAKPLNGWSGECFCSHFWRVALRKLGGPKEPFPTDNLRIFGKGSG